MPGACAKLQLRKQRNNDMTGSHHTNGGPGSPLPAARGRRGAHGVTRPTHRISGMQRATHENRRLMKQREALFRRFGYDSTASLKFVLAKALPLPGHVLEIGTGKGRFLAAMAEARQPGHDAGHGLEAAARGKARMSPDAGGRCRIRFVIHDAEHLPWPKPVSTPWPV